MYRFSNNDITYLLNYDQVNIALELYRLLKRRS